MEHGHPKNSMFSCGNQSCEDTMLLVIGLGFRSVATARAQFPVTDATSTLKGSSRVGNTLHVYVQEEEWEVVYRVVNNGKESETECAIILRGLSLEFEVCERNVTAPTHREIRGVNSD